MPLTEAAQAALITGASNLASAGVSAGSAAVKNRKSYKWTKELAKYQNDINLQNWRLQNYYNSPSQQMARLKAAGLNPNLVYQQGGAVTGAGEISAPGSSQFDYESPFQGVNFAEGFQAYRIASADIENKVADTVGKQADNVSKVERSKYASREAKAFVRGLELQNLVTEQQKAYLTSQTGLTTAQTQEAILNWSKIPVEIQKLRTDIRLSEKDMSRLDAVIKNVNANTDVLTAQYQKAIVENSLLNLRYAAEQHADRNTYELMIEQLYEQVERLNFENTPEWRTYQMLPDNVESFKFGPLSYSHNSKSTEAKILHSIRLYKEIRKNRHKSRTSGSW